jgi:hypothetical protein
MNEQPQPTPPTPHQRRHHGVRLILVEVTVPCCACGRPAPPGTRLRMWQGGRWIEHDGGCPPAWEPVVIPGGAGAEEARQLHLPLLAAVEEEP